MAFLWATYLKIVCRNENTASKIFEATKQWLNNRLKLEISPDKSCITNVKRAYTEFLGFKIKTIRKGKKEVVCSHLSDKAKKNVESKIKKQIYEVRRKPIALEVFKLNKIIAGLHNYYNIATQVSMDFQRINFNLSQCLKNRLKQFQNKHIMKTCFESKEYIAKYSRYKGKRIVIAKTVVYPIRGITTKAPMLFSQTICDYTCEGRKLIHSKLGYTNQALLNHLTYNPNINKSIKFNDNRISKYTAQKGLCSISGQILDINMETHHIKPVHMEGTDDYNNLLLTTYVIHKLIHATIKETIEKYLAMVNLDKDGIRKLNKYRMKVGNDII